MSTKAKTTSATTQASRPLALRPWEARWLASLGEGAGAVLWRPLKYQPEVHGGRMKWCPPGAKYDTAIDEWVPACIWKAGLNPIETGAAGIADHCPLGRPGDLLWCREVYCSQGWYSRDLFRADESDPDEVVTGSVCYKADGDEWWAKRVERKLLARDVKGHFGWYPAITMPRWASRTTLEVAAVEVRRVEELTEDEARAAGCDGRCPVGYIPAYEAGPLAYHFAYRWEEDFAKAGYPWASNPWAWRVAVVKRGETT